MSSPTDILTNPSEWPASFPNPEVATRVLTYLFDSESKVGIFVNFVKKNFPKALVKVVKDDKGYTNVTITQTSNEFAPPSQAFIAEQELKYSNLSDIYEVDSSPPVQSKFVPPTQEFIDELKAKYSNLSNIYAVNKPPQQQQANVEQSSSSQYVSYNIAQLQTAYQYNGIQNQVFVTKPLIAIVIFGSYSGLQSDFDLFCQNNNLPPYTLNIIPINNPPAESQAEMCIDTQLAYGMCPGADILVVQAESSSAQDLVTAVSVALTYNPQVLNMSLGFTEFKEEVEDNALDYINYNTIYIAATGDDNSVQWPSVNPNVLAVGATTLYTNSDGSISSQSTWSSTGCGPSEYFPIPSYQSQYTDLQSTSRNTCDISYVGNPDTGVQIYYNGEMGVYGGTSVAAPLMSGMLAIVNGIRINNGLSVINSASNSSLGFQNILYSNYASNGSQLFYDVTEGTSGAYSATTGWDIPTGLGTPYGEAVVNFLAGYNA